jgi:putative DNA modification/repair radical SAM protein
MKKSIFDKLAILSDSAKYDVSCSSSGSDASFGSGGIGAAHQSGICHTFTSDDRCVSLLKVLLTNHCIYDCAYCINRSGNDRERAAFSPRELADITINFYKRNYIEGLFLSSGIITSEDHTMELLLRVLKILRNEYRFGGYIHLKLIPGASPELIDEATALANRVSSNIELPSTKSLALLAPNKTKEKLLAPLKHARDSSLAKENKPIPMSTQMIIGASPESDLEILKLTSVLYTKALLKRVYYSAYIPVNEHKNLPALSTIPPLKREHRLYQTDWLLRFYGFAYDEILSPAHPNLDEAVDPKAFWALHHMHLFPVEINQAPKEILLRIPGIGMRSVEKIVRARRFKKLTFEDLKQMKISLKRAKHFILAGGKAHNESLPYPEQIRQSLIRAQPKQKQGIIQPLLFDSNWLEATYQGEL